MKKLLSKSYLLLALSALGLTYMSCSEHELPIVEYAEPVISDFSPKTGKPNTLVTISGTDFGDYMPAVSVSFAGVVTTDIDSLSNEVIQVRVPYGIDLEDLSLADVMVQVWTHEVSFGETTTFEVLPGIELGEISPDFARKGTELTLTGANFGTDINAVTVEFPTPAGEYVAAELLTISDTEITLIAPDGGATGALRISSDPEVLTGPSFIYEGPTVYLRKEAEDWDDMSGVQTEGTADIDGDLNVGWIDAGDWIMYSNYFMDDALEIDLRVASNGADGNVEIRLDSPTGTLVSNPTWTNTGGWQNWITVSAELTESTDFHDVYIIFVEGRANINWWKFNNEDDLAAAE